MIRPYLAILKDSFREATASRILWIAIIGIVLILLALAPFGLRNDRSVKLRQHELPDPEGLVRAIAAGAKETTTPAAHLWSLLNEEQQKRVEDWLKPENSAASTAPAQPNRGGNSRNRNSIRSQTVRLINDLLKKPEFYKAEAWSGDIANVTDEIRSAAAVPTSDENQQSFQNLKLLAATYPRFLDVREDPAVTLMYATSEIVGPIDLPPKQFTRVVDQMIIAVLSIFLGFFGVFGSLLVTASVIPRTYEPGEISLLMSKPISRSMLFITKFFGGCSFTSLCAVVLVTGIWLLLGLRMDIWRPQLLWCVPIYVFLFAIYFSVSALTGVIWRNPVVSLILVAVFWGVLTVVSVTRAIVEENVIKTRRIVDVTVAGKETFAVDGGRSVYRWNEGTGDWARVFDQPSGGVPRFVQRIMLSGTRFRPVYDPQSERILALQAELSRFGGPGPGTIVSGTADGNWEREIEATTPDAVLGLFVDSSGRVLLPGRRAIYQFVGQSDQQKQAQQFLGNMLGGLLRSSKSAFTELQPKDMPQLSPTAVAAMDPIRNSLVLFDKGVVYRMDPGEEGKYVAGPSRDLQTTESAVIAAGGKFILIAFSTGRAVVLDQETLETVTDESLGQDIFPRIAESAPDGSRLAVLTHEDRVVVFDGSTGSRLDWNPAESGHVSAMAFDQDNNLIVSNGRRSLSIYGTDPAQPPMKLAGIEDLIFSVYDYLLKPLHTVLPKPSDMDNAVTWIVTGETSFAVGDDSNGPFGNSDRTNLQQDRITFDAWTPIWTNLAFITVMLAAGCVFVAWRDF